MSSIQCFSGLSSVNIRSILKNKKSDKKIKEDEPTADRHGHMICRSGATINNKYRIVKKLGKGHFGRVVKVIDTKTDKVVALKISRNNSKSRKTAKMEIMALRYLGRVDPNDTSLCAKMITSFAYNGHMCITFEVLGKDIYHFLKQNEFAPFPLHQIRHIAYQLCYAVAFLHRRGIIHTDLKPDNILFVDSSYTKQYNTERNKNIRLINRTDIRLIDFGCAVGDELPQSHTISNRNYRAPEVVLSKNWSHPVDVWATGCVLYELYTGNVLLNTEEDDLEHLGIMELVIGAIPQTMTMNHDQYFSNGKLNFDCSKRPLDVKSHQPLRTSIKTQSCEDDFLLIDLIEKMLVFEPSQRITMNGALEHSFFDKLPSHQRTGTTDFRCINQGC